MTKTVILLAFASVLTGLASAADETPAYWQGGSSWARFDEPANWKIGDPETGAAGVPGMGNYIWMTPTSPASRFRFNLNGGDFSVGGMSALNTTAYGAANGYATTLSITNGTLTLQGHVAGKLSYEVWNGATLSLSTDVRRAWDGNVQKVTVKPGGRFEEHGTLEFTHYVVTVEPGGTYVHDPSAFGVYYKSSDQANGLTNSGRFEAPNGIIVTYTTSTTGYKDGLTTYRNEDDGVFLLGGSVRNTTQPTQAYAYEFVGGTLEISNEVAFVGFRDMDRLLFDNAVEVKVDDDSSLTLAGFVYGENAVLTKTGPGKLALGENAVPSLAVQAGTVEVGFGAALPGTVSFANGAVLRLATTAVAMSPTAYDGMTFSVDEEVCTPGAALLLSDDAAFLAYAKGRLAQAMPSGFGVRLDGNAIRITQEVDNSFDAAKSDDLSDPTAWKGGEVPVGQDVVLAGAGIVRYGASAPAFASITVQDGATLAVEGGSEEVPVDLPPLTLNYHARLLVATDAVAQLTNVFDCVGDSETLPVLEIATNATLVAQSPEHPSVRSSHSRASYGGPDYGFRLSNVRLNWYGTIKTADGDLGDIETFGLPYRYSRLTLGYAPAGETAYIAVDCQGGRYLAAAEGSQTGRCLSALVIATPQAGGTVVPVGALRFRDYTREEQRPTVSSHPMNAVPGIFIGRTSQWDAGNPASVDYEVVFEGETDLSVNGNCIISGGAHVTVKGPAQWRYVRTAANDETLIRSIRLYDTATLTVDGGYLDICSTDDTSFRGLMADGSEDGRRVFTARDARLSLLNWSGAALGTAFVENSLLEIGYLRSAKTFGLVDGVFNGLKSVELARQFTIAAADVDRARAKESVVAIENWNRWVRIGAPLAGTGSIAVSNELSGAHAVYSMTVVVTNGENTATGEAKVLPTDSGAPAYLAFADGANWAGTVVADGKVSLTNLVDEAGAATVSFNALDGTLPLRVWKTGGAIVANDKVSLATAGGSFALVAQDEALAVGDSVEIGLYPEGAPLPQGDRYTAFAAVPSETPGFVTLKASVVKPGLVLVIR